VNDPADPAPHQPNLPLVGVLVITAATDSDSGLLRLRVRSTSDVLSRRDDVLYARDAEEVRRFVTHWLARFRDADEGT